MTQFRHKTPCEVCPMRRDSLKGWIGASTPQEFIDQIDSEQDMPCHNEVDYEDKNWKLQVQSASACAGVLIFLKNRCKSPRSTVLNSRVKQVERDVETVFNWPVEVINHHTRRTK